MTAQARYEALSSDRNQFLQSAIDASKLTLPYLIKQDEDNSSHKTLLNPYQSVGAKGVVTLASKLMLALLPVQTSFFKLQVDETSLIGEGIDPKVRSDLDLSFSKIERTMMESIAASDDRVTVHQALKHLVVAGNALIYMAKDKLKLYPLNRYVVDRDGLGNVIEIVTKERINKKLVEEMFPQLKSMVVDSEESYAGTGQNNQCDVYTHIRRDNNRFVWHQEVYGKIIPKSQGKAPLDTNPWLALRFNTVDNEAYGRGRVEEFIGDLKSLDALSQAIIEGSAAAAKVVFTVSPSSTTKPSTLAKAGNGAIVQGRPDDIGVVQVGKTADFNTAYQMIQSLERRIAEAFLILTVRNSERTTAEEVRMTQMELEQQLGGLFSLLTVDFLVPYLNRKLSVAQKSGEIPRLPSNLVKPTIVAGVNALGRGQDRESLSMFMQTIAATMGPEAIIKYINPEEVVKRLATSQGIDVLNLVRTAEEVQGEQQAAQEQQEQLELTKQASRFAQVAQAEGQQDQPQPPATPQQINQPTEE
tara:strand:+ start:1252 stop:2838 length:1587 start_codon:yes stop_codon:yes gene_type:complete